MKAWTVIAVALGVFGGVGPLLAQAGDAEADVGAVLQPGDSVRITVWRDPQLSGEFVIGADGTPMHPLYRTVRVGGVPAAVASENLRVFLTRFSPDPQFVIEPLHQVAVVGEVNRPSLYAMPPQTTIAQAVARAGGVTQAGRSDRVRVLRRTPLGATSELRVDLTRGAAPGTAELIRSGDQIVVDRRKSFLRDLVLPALTVLGSAASIGIFIDRASGN